MQNISTKKTEMHNVINSHSRESRYLPFPVPLSIGGDQSVPSCGTYFGVRRAAMYGNMGIFGGEELPYMETWVSLEELQAQGCAKLKNIRGLAQATKLEEHTGVGARECFLDLGSFPEDRKISVDTLLDIWVHVRNMEWHDAFVILLELASRNLLNLTSNLRSQAINASELYFSQHDVMRDLALYLASQGSIVRRKTLLMPKKEDSLPGKWKLLKDQVFDAQIVSKQISAMEDHQWCEMNFPQAEALVLLFSASKYFLPSFLSSMRKLKVLIVFNYGSKRATVNGLPALSSLTQLKTIHLERLNVPPLQEHSKVLRNLEKLSLSLCEGLGNMSRFNSSQYSLKLPIMLDFNLDHCCDLEELPSGICDKSSVEKWSITSCHLLGAMS